MTTEAPPRPSTPQPSIYPGPSEPARWRRYLPTPKFLTLGVVALIIAYLAIVPLYYLFWGTFFDATGLTFSGFQRAYGNDQIFGLVGNSLLFAVGAAVISLIMGTGLAYLNVRTDVPFKALFFAASIIPLVIPGHPLHDRVDPVGQPGHRADQPLPRADLRPRGHRRLQHLGHDLGRGTSAVPDRLPAHGGVVPRHGPVAGGVGVDVGRQPLDGVPQGHRSAGPARDRRRDPDHGGAQPGELRGARTARPAERHLRLHQPDLLRASRLPAGPLGGGRAGHRPAGDRHHRRGDLELRRPRGQELPDRDRQGIPPAPNGTRQVAPGRRCADHRVLPADGDRPTAGAAVHVAAEVLCAAVEGHLLDDDAGQLPATPAHGQCAHRAEELADPRASRRPRW